HTRLQGDWSSDVCSSDLAKLLRKNSKAYGIQTTLGVQYVGTVVVITTGTFLRGLMHIGSNQQSGGRAGESAAMNLSDSLREMGRSEERRVGKECRGRWLE